MYGLVRYVRAEWALNALARQVLDDHVAQHLAVPVAQHGIKEIAAEDCAEGVTVGDAEDAERADHHVYVDGVDIDVERAVGAAPVEDPLDQLDRRAVLAGEVV